MQTNWLSMVLAFVLAGLLAGCSSDNQSDLEEKKAHFYERGMYFLDQENHDAALIEFKNAIQIDPKYSEARFQLARIYLKKKDLGAAVSELIRVQDSDPDNLTIF